MTRAFLYLFASGPQFKSNLLSTHGQAVTSDYLFVRPNFLDGFASVIDVWGSPWPYNYSETEEEADIRALMSDWAVVGHDLKMTIDSCKLKLPHAHADDLVLAEHDS